MIQLFWVGGGKAEARAIERAERMDSGRFSDGSRTHVRPEKIHPIIAICKYLNDLRELAV